MKSRLLSRVERLEVRLETGAIGPFRSGYVKRLPEGYIGKRHIVVVHSEPVEGSPNHEWCEFEERPGLAPPDWDVRGFPVLLERGDDDEGD